MNNYTAPSYYHQLGHNDQKRCLELLHDGYGAGAILSPANLNRGEDTLQRYAQEYKATNTELLVDPQLYSSEIMSQNYPITDTRDLIRDEQLSNTVLRNALEQQKQLAATRLLIPSPFFDLPTNEFTTILTNFSQRGIEWAESQPDRLSVYATVPISTATITEEEPRLQLLNTVATLNVDGLYIVPEIPNNPNQVALIYGLLDIAFRLRRRGFNILMGFSDLWALLVFPFGLEGFASSGVKNRRSFQKGQWRKQVRPGGSGPQYYQFWTPKLLGYIKFPQEAELLRKAGLWDLLNNDSPYAPIFDGSSPTEIFNSGRWTFGRSNQNYSWMMTDIAKRFENLDYYNRIEAVKELISEAQEKYKIIQRKGINLDQMGIQLETWNTALDLYIRSNASKIEDQFN